MVLSFICRNSLQTDLRRKNRHWACRTHTTSGLLKSPVSSIMTCRATLKRQQEEPHPGQSEAVSAQFGLKPPYSSAIRQEEGVKAAHSHWELACSCPNRLSRHKHL